MARHWFRSINKEVTLKYESPKIPEGINVTETHPLKEFAFLTSTVIAFVVAITVVLSYSVDWFAGFIPFEFEKNLVKPYETQVSERNEIDSYLQSLADRLATNMALPDDMKITVHYIDDETVNAFATLGGHVMVFRGLMERLPNENALIMLLGHEMAHIKLRHPLKALGKGVVISMMLSAVVGQSSDAVGQVMSDAGMMTMLGFSREQEEDADEEGLRAVYNHYQHTQGALDLFKVLQQESDEQSRVMPQLLSSHPQIENRITHLTQMAQQQGWRQQGEINAIPQNVVNGLIRASSLQVAE